MFYWEAGCGMEGGGSNEQKVDEPCITGIYYTAQFFNWLFPRRPTSQQVCLNDLSLQKADEFRNT